MSISIDGLSLTDRCGPIEIIKMFTGDGRYEQRLAAVPRTQQYEISTTGSVAIFRSSQAAGWSVKLSMNIERLRQLSPGWDGPGSLPIDKSLLNRVNALVRESLELLGGNARPPFVVPLSSGGVQAEWHTVRGELELELAANGNATIWVRDNSTGHEFEAEGAKALNQFLLWAPWLAEEQPYGSDVPTTKETLVVAFAA